MSEIALSVGFLSLGCPKNLVDSQIMAESLLDQGFTLAPSPERADVIIVNTCAFIEDARGESLDAIEAACEQKAAGGCQAVLVAGCMPQRYQSEIQDALPSVDAFIGLDRIDEAGDIIHQLIASKEKVYAVTRKAERVFAPKSTVVFSSGAHAFLKIAEGCNHGCTFCAIPGIRGKHRSRALHELVQEAHLLLQKGFRELDLIAQDIMAYGNDLTPATSLDELLQAIATSEGEYWIRLLYGYPSLLTDALLETVAAYPAICPYLDIPIQHSHPDMLRAMRRAGTAQAAQNMPTRIRTYLPDATLRTTALVGFPGETDAHFEHLREYLAAAQFDHLGVFCFSPEAGTPAANMPNQVPTEVAASRQAMLMQDQQKRVRKALRQSKGKHARVLIEAPGKKTGTLRARHAGQAPDVDGVVWINNPLPSWKPGTFADVIYTGSRGYDLLAQPANARL